MRAIEQSISSPVLGVAAGAGSDMRKAHFHCDLELNCLEGSAPCLYRDPSGTEKLIQPGRLFLFFALYPHRLKGAGARMRWATLSPFTLLSHALAPELLYRILVGEFIWAANADKEDARSLKCWEDDLQSGCRHKREAARLEIEARVRRLWAEQEEQQAASKGPMKPGALSAVKLATFMIARFRDPVLPRDAAKAAGLSIGYAGGCFRNAFGLTMGDFLARLRLNAAVRMLADTNRTTLDVALACGYSTLSVFYKAFKDKHGCPPGEFRANAG